MFKSIGVSLFVLLCVAGCNTFTVHVPQTAQGMSCARKCKQMHYTCNLGTGSGRAFDSEGMARKFSCDHQENECRAACPGAILELE